MNRRSFLKSAGGGVAASMVATSPVPGSPVSPNEKIGVAVMGVNGRGRGHVEYFSSMPDVDLQYICEVDETVVAPALKIAATNGAKPKVVDDIRRVLDDKNVDAVSIATPVHWHAAATILACDAGKDVYVEKPMSHNVQEGRVMIEAARRSKSVVQVGSQSRSRPITHRFVEFVQSGKIGNVLMAKVANVEKRPDLGHKADEPVPDGLNYDLWTGPAPMLPFNRNRFHRTYSWNWHFGAAELGDNGSHWLDICRWVLEVDYPTEVSGMGCKLAFDDDKETPDTDNLTFNYKDKLILWEERLWTPYGFEGSENTIIIFGTDGMVQAGRWVGGRYAFRVFDSEGAIVHYEQEETPEEGILPHVRNFLDCVRTRKQPVADLEVGQVSTVMCHLGNIVCRTGRNLKFDPKTETILDDPEANALLTREYRDHWSAAPFLT